MIRDTKKPRERLGIDQSVAPLRFDLLHISLFFLKIKRMFRKPKYFQLLDYFSKIYISYKDQNDGWRTYFINISKTEAIKLWSWMLFYFELYAIIYQMFGAFVSWIVYFWILLDLTGHKSDRVWISIKNPFLKSKLWFKLRITSLK